MSCFISELTTTAVCAKPFGLNFFAKSQQTNNDESFCNAKDTNGSGNIASDI